MKPLHVSREIGPLSSPTHSSYTRNRARRFYDTCALLSAEILIVEPLHCPACFLGKSLYQVTANLHWLLKSFKTYLWILSWKYGCQLDHILHKLASPILPVKVLKNINRKCITKILNAKSSTTYNITNNYYWKSILFKLRKPRLFPHVYFTCQ